MSSGAFWNWDQAWLRGHFRGMCEIIHPTIGSRSDACHGCLDLNNTIFCGDSCYLNHNASISNTYQACFSECQHSIWVHTSLDQCPVQNVKVSVVLIAVVVLLCPIAIFFAYLALRCYLRKPPSSHSGDRANILTSMGPVPLAHVVLSTTEEAEEVGGRGNIQLASASLASASMSSEYALVSANLAPSVLPDASQDITSPDGLITVIASTSNDCTDSIVSVPSAVMIWSRDRFGDLSDSWYTFHTTVIHRRTPLRSLEFVAFCDKGNCPFWTLRLYVKQYSGAFNYRCSFVLFCFAIHLHQIPVLIMFPFYYCPSQLRISIPFFLRHLHHPICRGILVGSCVLTYF